MGMDPLLEKGDILPLFNRAWLKYFSKCHTNKKAIRDQGWYPANQCLLKDPKIMKTRVATAVRNEEDTASEFASISLSNIDTTVNASPWIDLNNLNFDRGSGG